MEARFRSAYGVIPRVQLDCSSDEDLAKQAFRDECDINNIIRRFVATNVLDHINEAAPQYGDATGIDFAKAMDIVLAANNAFGALPGVLRKRFGNDPREYVAFLEDPANNEEAVRLGLRVKPEPPAATPAAAPIAAPSPSPAAPAAAPA